MSEETEAEKTNSEPSSISKEESLDAARELLKQGILSLEAISAKTGCSLMTVRGLKGGQIRAQKKLVAAQADRKTIEAQAQAYRDEVKALSKPETEFQAEDEPNIDLEGEVGSHTSPSNLTPSSLPGSIPLLEEDRAAVRKLVSKTALGPLEVIWDNAARRERQRFDNNGHGNNGYSTTSTSADEDLKRAEAETEREYGKLLHDQRMQERLGHGEKNENELSRRLDRIENKLDNSKQGSELLQVAKALTELSRPKGEGRDPIEYVLAGNQMRSDIEKNVQSQYSTGVQKSRIDLELEAMQQSERLDYKKLEYDERRADKKDAADNKKWEFADKVVKFFGSEHAGAAIEAVGASMADKIRGQGAQIPMATIICPRCQGHFKTNPELPHAMCPRCGAMLDKPPAPEAQQPAQEQPSESEQPAPKGPSADVSTDAVEPEPEKQKSETKPEEVIT